MLDRQQRYRPIADMNIVPYVDVMLVLLVIFMAATPMIMQGVVVDLPVATAEPLKDQEQAPLIVSVNQQGQAFLNISHNPTAPMTPLNLKAEVIAALAFDAQRPVLVRADKAVSYDKVLQVMVILQQAGVPNIGLETDGVTAG